MLSEINCVIIDDEPKLIELLQKRLKLLYPNVKLKASFTKWEEGVEFLKAHDTDLLFLDVSMPGKNGVDFLKLFPVRTFEVIFITAHAEFAVEAIKLSALGYVLKPVDDEELSFAVNKFFDKRAKVGKAGSENKASKVGIPNVKGVDYFNPEDILYFETVNKYTKVVTDNFSIVSSYNIGEFDKILNKDIFFRVHRSFIINMNRVKRYESAGAIVMEDEMQIPVSKSNRMNFAQAFNNISRIAGH